VPPKLDPLPALTDIELREAFSPVAGNLSPVELVDPDNLVDPDAINCGLPEGSADRKYVVGRLLYAFGRSLRIHKFSYFFTKQPLIGYWLSL
jgi:hypothetical protein